MQDKGRASKAVVLEFTKNVHQFKEIISKEIENIKKEAIALGSDWKDQQYKDFLLYTSDIVNQLKNDIKTLDEIEENLKIKAKMF